MVWETHKRRCTHECFHGGTEAGVVFGAQLQAMGLISGGILIGTMHKFSLHTLCSKFELAKP